MNIARIPPDTSVRPSAASIRLGGSGRSGVLLLHGYTGYPGEMGYLGERLNDAGFTVAIPRLPGHGTNGGDFAQTTWRDWLRGALDAFLDLRADHEEVSVAGLSMGGLLALILAAQLRPRRIALAAPALLVSNKQLYLTPVLRLALKSLPKALDPAVSRGDPDRELLARDYWNREWMVQLAHLLHLQRLARRTLGRVTCPALTIASKGDRTVPASVAAYVERRIGAEVKRSVVLERSPHVLVDDIEKERVADEIVGWFQARDRAAERDL